MKEKGTKSLSENYVLSSSNVFATSFNLPKNSENQTELSLQGYQAARDMEVIQVQVNLTPRPSIQPLFSISRKMSFITSSQKI